MIPRPFFEMGAASQLEVDTAKLQLDNARASMNSALDQLQVGMQNYKATMEQLEASLANINSNGNVVAPISGNIVSLSATENGFLSPGRLWRPSTPPRIWRSRWAYPKSLGG